MGIYFCSSFVICFMVCVSEYAASQDYYELRHAQHLKTEGPDLKQIPKRFELSGPNPQFQLSKYISEIQRLAKHDNITVQYKVKVEVDKIPKTGNKLGINKKKSKKFNVPLKKKNMRLSNFEILMRKLADDNAQQLIVNPVRTTQDVGLREEITTTRMPVMKYKPIISRVRLNYGKQNARPVRKQEITL